MRNEGKVKSGRKALRFHSLLTRYQLQHSLFKINKLPFSFFALPVVNLNSMRLLSPLMRRRVNQALIKTERSRLIFFFNVSVKNFPPFCHGHKIHQYAGNRVHTALRIHRHNGEGMPRENGTVQWLYFNKQLSSTLNERRCCCWVVCLY